LNPNDKDSRLLVEMEKVHARVDNELNYIFDKKLRNVALYYFIKTNNIMLRLFSKYGYFSFKLSLFPISVMGE